MAHLEHDGDHAFIVFDKDDLALKPGERRSIRQLAGDGRHLIRAELLGNTDGSVSFELVQLESLRIGRDQRTKAQAR